MTPIEREWGEMTPQARHAESRRLAVHALTDALGDIYLWMDHDTDKVLEACAASLLDLRAAFDFAEVGPLTLRPSTYAYNARKREEAAHE